MITLAILAVLLGIAWASAVHLDRNRRRARAALIEGRASLDEHEIWVTYYRNSEIDENAFKAAWNLIAQQAQLDPKKMRPTDLVLSFVQVSETRHVQDEWGDLIIKWGNIAHKYALNIDWTSIKTVDQVLRVVITCWAAGMKERKGGGKRSETN